MLELKRSLNDPQKIETDVSRALDLAFNNKDLAALGGNSLRDISQDHYNLKSADFEPVVNHMQHEKPKSTPQSKKLRINSREHITLEEEVEDDENDDQGMFNDGRDDDNHDCQDGEEEESPSQMHVEERRINKMLREIEEEKNMHSQGTNRIINEIQKIVQQNQAMDSMDQMMTPLSPQGVDVD